MSHAKKESFSYERRVSVRPLRAGKILGSPAVDAIGGATGLDGMLAGLMVNPWHKPTRRLAPSLTTLGDKSTFFQWGECLPAQRRPRPGLLQA